MILFTVTSMVFFSVGILSMLTHSLKKYAQGEIVGNLIDWYWMNPRATLGAFLTCLGGVATAILSGVLNDYTVGAQLLAVWGIGYASDTVNNQGKV